MPPEQQSQSSEPPQTLDQVAAEAARPVAPATAPAPAPAPAPAQESAPAVAPTASAGQVPTEAPASTDAPVAGTTAPGTSETTDAKETAAPNAEAAPGHVADSPLAHERYSWQASEYVHHHKGAGWYFGLFVLVGILLLTAIIYKLWLSIAVFIAMGAAVAVYAHKPPRTLTYELDESSITIEGRSYGFDSFRSFGVLSDESWHTIDLEPVKRLMPRLTLLFSDEDFDDIVAYMEAHLPRIDREPDIVERLTRYLRF